MKDQMPRWSGLDPLAQIRSRQEGKTKRGHQQELLPLPDKPAGKWKNTDSIARVIPDTPVFHLAIGLDYTIPPRLAGKTRIGSLVSVRIGEKLVHAWVKDIRPPEATSQRLRPISRVLSDRGLVSPKTFQLAQQVVSRYAGNISQVLNQAIPNRRAGIEKEFFTNNFAPVMPLTSREAPCQETNCLSVRDEPKIENYPQGKGLLDSLANKRRARVVWSAIPEPNRVAPFNQISELVSVALKAKGSVLCLFPTARQASEFCSYWSASQGANAPSPLKYFFEKSSGRHYQAYLQCRFNHPRLVVGTRSAIFAPLKGISLLLIWDENAETYQEQTAPYWHSRQVAMMRANSEKCSLILGSYSRSPQAQALVLSSWASELAMNNTPVLLPKIFTPDYEQRDDLSIGRTPISSTAIQFLRSCLENGPVLVQVGRRGGRKALSCARCSAPLRCPKCLGQVEQRGDDYLCPSCGHSFFFRCPNCGAQQARAAVRGHQRIGRELAAAFPKIPVINCDADNSLPPIGTKPTLVVATVDQEPVASNGYAGALLLDAGMLISLDRIWAGEQTLRRWANLGAKVAAKGKIMLSGDPGEYLATTFKRRTFREWASKELQERAEVGIPPTAAMAAIRASKDTLNQLLACANFPDMQVIEPVRFGNDWQVIVRARLDQGEELRAELSRLQALASRKKWGPVKVQVDPYDF